MVLLLELYLGNIALPQAGGDYIMYHCHTIFYLAGEQSELFDPVRELAPLEGFTHELLESRKPEQALAARADVTLADLRGADRKSVV